MPNKRWVGLIKKKWFKKKKIMFNYFLNILTISLFSYSLEGTKETSYSFFNNFWSLMDLSVEFESRWSFDHLSEKKERIDLIGFPTNSLISSESRWLFISFAHFLNSRDIEEYPERHENRSDSIFVRFVWIKEGFQRIDLFFSYWISL